MKSGIEQPPTTPVLEC